MSTALRRPLKRITVRVAGPVRLTAAATAIYGSTCPPDIQLPGLPALPGLPH
ncbi:hypothetical protein AB0D49_24590 [Streptomyces sp. NPDC048290]|uniref:hypothetical protein n=1 Tax=Streptomyces sp. NPDC048290 TaxID=3155811 RepID=UPI00342CF28E